MIGLPLLGLALIPLFARRPGWRGPGARALLAGLGALTVAFALVWLTVPGWTYNFADEFRTYALDELGERLGQDVARLFPSSTRPRPATWLWPPVTMVGGDAALVGARSAPRAGGQGSRMPPGSSASSASPSSSSPPPCLRRRCACPPRVVEIEDPWVHKSGGHVYPDRWVIERARHRGGWVVRVGEHVEAPVETGGSRVRLVLHGQLVQNQPVPFRLDIRAGDRLLAVWAPARDREWRAVDLGTFDWPAGAPLVLTAFGPRHARTAQRRRAGPGGIPMAEVTVSAVVPTLGRSRWLILSGSAAKRRQDRSRNHRHRPGDVPVEIPAGLADQVLRPGRNLGFAAGTNLGIAEAAGELIATVNDDALVEPGWLAALASALDREPRAAAAQGVNLLMDDPVRADGCGLEWNRWWRGGPDRPR